MPSLMRYCKTLCLLLVTVSWVPTSYASPTSASSSIVHVEVIIFQTLATRGWTEEYWPLTPGIMPHKDAIKLNTEASVIPESPDALDAPEFSAFFNLLPADQLILNDVADSMTPTKGYDILAHFAWQQPALSQNNSPHILIDQYLQINRLETSAIFGGMRAYQERFNHIEVELELDRRIPSSLRERFASYHGMELASLPENWTFLIKESRRIRPGELHYIDHPLFGVIVQISRVAE